MRYDKGHKDETHRRIIDVAAKEFRKNGIASVGIATIMKESDLTNGAFYSHFSSKEALVKEVLGELLDQQDDLTVTAFENGSSLKEIINSYLSPLHRDNCETGCPTAALLSELIHHSKSTKTLFTKKLEIVFERFAKQLEEKNTPQYKKAISIFSLMIGALQLSRAVTKESLSDQILKDAADTALQIISLKN